MELQIASRKNAKIKMALQGPSGSGKTYSSLLVAYGLCQDYSKVAVIDTENHSAELYAHLGNYNVINLTAPFEPEKYREALRLCEDSGMEVVIIDSLTHEWEYLIDYHSNLPGNSFTAWAKVTPRHNAFIQAILQSPCHVVATVRTKQDYVVVEKNNKQVPEKIGLKGVQRDGLEYDFTLVFDLDIRNNANTSKDRTGLFWGKPEGKLSIQTGNTIKEWCNSGESITAEDITQRIGACNTLGELLQLYHSYPQLSKPLSGKFQEQKRLLQLQNPNAANQLINKQISPNGKH